MMNRFRADKMLALLHAGVAGSALWLASSVAAQGLSLHSAVQQAFTSPEAQEAVAQIDEAKGGLRQAGLGLNPRLFLQAEDFRPWASDYDFPTQTEDYGFLSQTFELDGKRHKRAAVAAAELQKARSDAEWTRQSIAGRVAGAYWTAVVSDRIATLLQEDMAAVDEMVRYHKERVEAGAMRGVDLLRIEIERDRLQVALVTAERDRARSRLELFRQMGRPPVPGIELTDSIDALGAIAPVPIETVLARHADLESARDALAAAQADVRLQRADGVPDLDLIGGYKRNGANNTGYGGLQIPLAFHNRNQGGIERAEASVRYAQARLAALDLQVRAQVAESEASYRSEGEIVRHLLPEMRSEAKQNLQLMTEAYRIGGVDLLRFLDAERTAFDVEVSALRSLAEFQQTALRLQLSYGVQP